MSIANSSLSVVEEIERKQEERFPVPSLKHSALSVTEAAEKRRSIRSFRDEQIPDVHLRDILQVAGRSPSAWNIQPWRVTVVRDPEVKGKLREAAYGQKQVGAAPAVLVVWSDMTDALANIDDFVPPTMTAEQAEKFKQGVLSAFTGQSQVDQENWARNQSNIFLGYLLLSIESMGYSSSPMLGFDSDKVKELLNIPSHATIPAIVAIGKADEEGFLSVRHPIDPFVTFVG